MNPPSSPEPEDLPAKPQTLAQCHEVIDTLGQQLAQLREQVAWLQERVKLDSRNSSKPPSSDVAGTSRPRRSSERKRGGQPGHKGTYRTLLDEGEVDAVHECPPPEVCECGGPIEPGRALRHQVTDLAQAVRAEVQEYRLYRGVCGHCRKTHESRLPAGVPRGQIGPRALALIGALGTRYHLTQDKIRTLLGEVLGVRFSLGAISQAQGLVAQALQAPVQQAAASCHGAAVLHMDETSWRQAGSGTRHWVWATVQPQVVVYQVLPSRARYVAQALAGERPAGVLVTDRYAVYDWVAPERRQVCWAHLLRDFERIAGRAGAAGCVGRRLLGLGRVLFRWRARDAGPADFARLQARVHQALERGTRSGCRRTAQTCANLLRQEVSLWTFVRHPGVEPTNNAAEQALRTVVLKRKISGPTRSMRGQQFVARGFSAMESCRRQGRDLRDWMEQALRAWLGAGPVPSLLPSG